MLAIHARAIAEFGGVHGVRDEGALEAALTAAEYRTYYEQALLTICAATYAYHLPKPTPSWMATSALPQPWQKSFLN